MLNKISKKAQKKRKELFKVYDEMANTREHKCTGCGRYKAPLSHSHIIPRSRRPDLTTDIKNITYHCLSMAENIGCHDIWEHGTTEEKQMMLDYETNMEYVKSVDSEYYELMKLKS